MPTTISGSTGVSQVQDGSINSADLATAVLPIGVGQTWQDVKSSRALGTTYTNNTGRPIFLTVSTASAGDTSITVTINGLAIRLGRNSVSGGEPFGSILIPAGATYSVANSGALQTWFELR